MKTNSDSVDKGFSSIYQEYEDLNLGNNKTVWQRKLVYRHFLSFAKERGKYFGDKCRVRD